MTRTHHVRRCERRDPDARGSFCSSLMRHREIRKRMRQSARAVSAVALACACAHLLCLVVERVHDGARKAARLGAEVVVVEVDTAARPARAVVDEHDVAVRELARDEATQF